MQALVIYGEHPPNLALRHLVHALAAPHQHSHRHIVPHIHRILIVAEEVRPLVVVRGSAQLSTNKTRFRLTFLVLMC